MIGIDNAEILDILPYTMKEKYKPLSLALKRMRVEVLYSLINKVIHWADIDNAPEEALDAMAAELDAPFYSSDMSAERKRSIIKATDTYNSRIGTVSSITALVAAAFNNGDIEEWYNYGGDPYYFKLTVLSAPPLAISKTGYELLESRLDKVKPKRAKLEGITFKRSIRNDIYVGIGVIKTYKKFTIPAGQTPDAGRGFN